MSPFTKVKLNCIWVRYVDEGVLSA